MPSRSFLILVALSIVAHLLAESSCGQAPPPASAAEFTLLDGSTVAARSLVIENGKITGDGVPANLTLDDLRRIDLPADGDLAQQPPAAIVALRGGGQIRAKNVTIADDKCRIEWTASEPLSLPVDSVRGVLLDGVVASAEYEKALAAPSAELDQVFVKDQAGSLSRVAGVIDALDGGQMKLNVGSQEHRVPRPTLHALVVAQPAVVERAPQCLVKFNGGSILGGDSLTLAKDRATLEIPGGGKAVFSWRAAARIDIRSNRVAFLSDLKPIAEEQQPLVTLALPAQRDKSASARPLTLGEVVYEKGLGVHARSSLTFAAAQQWDTLAATIGLDAAAGGQGDCLFIVIADGQTLLTRRMKGTDLPQAINVPITGREQVTLVVDPGEGLDLADHANWCDARFIKYAK